MPWRGNRLLPAPLHVRVKDLVNGTSIAPAPHKETIEYFQIVLDSHDVVLAEGVPAETFLLTANNIEGFANFGGFARLYPGDQHRILAINTVRWRHTHPLWGWLPAESI